MLTAISFQNDWKFHNWHNGENMQLNKKSKNSIKFCVDFIRSWEWFQAFRLAGKS